MADSWFYGRGTDITGPVSCSDLATLVAAGGVLPTDMVWRDGVEDGVPAAQVPELYPPAAAVIPPPEKKKARAVAGKGVMIVAQDGRTVKFRMKCTTCGKEDASWKSIQIPHGLARTGFFCSKCRKRRDGEIHGYH